MRHQTNEKGEKEGVEDSYHLEKKVKKKTCWA